MDFLGFKKYKLKATFLSELASGVIKQKHICFIVETGELWTNGDYYPKLPKATQSTIGMVMGGNNIQIGSDGSINWTGQIKNITYWVANQNWGSGSVGEIIAIHESLITKITGQNTVPGNGDIVITLDGYQYIVSEKDTTDRYAGIIVTVPPATAIWSNISGSLTNNQFMPAEKSDGSGSVNIIGLDSSDTVQIGNSTNPVNVKTSEKLRVNNTPVVLVDELNLVKDTLNQEILGVKNDVGNITTDYDTKIGNETTAREQEDARLKNLLDLEIADRGAGDLDLANKINAIIDDNTPKYNATYSSQKITNQILQVYHTIPDVQTFDDLPSESSLTTPSICYVIAEKTQYINSNSGSGWHASGGDFITVDDLIKYLKDTGYINSANLVNNLTTNDSTKALSASMGKYLNDNKLSATTTVDNLTSKDIKNPLSANMGRFLNESKLGTSDVINNLTSDLPDKPLSGLQGKVLNTGLLELKTYFTGTKAKESLLSDSSKAADKLSATKRLTVKLSGSIVGTGYVDTDFSGNPTVNIVTQGGESTSTLQQKSTSWYHYNKGNTIACLCRFKISQQFSLNLMFYDNFQGHYSVNFACRPIPEPTQVGTPVQAAGRNDLAVAGLGSNSRIAAYAKSDGFVYVYFVNTNMYHICGFVATLSTEGGGNLEVLPLGNGKVVAVAEMQQNVTYTYLTSFNLFTLSRNGSNYVYQNNETIRKGYVAPS